MSTKEIAKVAAAHRKKNPYSFGAALKNGGPDAWLSCLIFGFGNMKAGQLIKGLLYLAVELGIITYMVLPEGVVCEVEVR